MVNPLISFIHVSDALAGWTFQTAQQIDQCGADGVRCVAAATGTKVANRVLFASAVLGDFSLTKPGALN